MNFALMWIGIYVVLMSVADSISETIGIAKIVTAPIWHGIAGSFFLCVVSLAYAVSIIYKTKEEKE